MSARHAAHDPFSAFTALSAVNYVRPRYVSANMPAAGTLGSRHSVSSPVSFPVSSSVSSPVSSWFSAFATMSPMASVYAA